MMRRLILLLLTAAFAAAGSIRAQDAVSVTVTNPSAAARTDEVVRIDWSEIDSYLPASSSLRATDESGDAVLAQSLDEDGDGRPDALLILADFRPGERRDFMVRPADDVADTPPPRSYAAHEPERDDVAWENDLTAFRTYGEGLRELEDLVSSGIDVWTKRTTDLVIDRWYAGGHYHTDTGEGADFFGVGASLGGGGTAVWRNGRLFRAPNFRAHRIIAAGPIRSILELEYGPWDAGGIQMTETKRITIDAGSRFFLSESTFRADGDTDSLTVATGLVKRSDAVGSFLTGESGAWLGMWGPVNPAAGGHGDLGTAVAFPREHSWEVAETDAHYLMRTGISNGATTRHHVGAVWTATGAAGSASDWWAMIEAHLDRASAPPLDIAISVP